MIVTDELTELRELVQRLEAEQEQALERMRQAHERWLALPPLEKAGPVSRERLEIERAEYAAIKAAAPIVRKVRRAQAQLAALERQATKPEKPRRIPGMIY